MESLRSTLQRHLGRALGQLPAEERLAAAWAVAAGGSLSARARVVGYDNATASVTLAVAGAQWVEALGAMRPKLAGELARVSGLPVRALHLRLDTAGGDPAGRDPS